MEGYLAHKWGSTANLPSGHPFKSTAPDFGGSQTIVTNGNTIPVVSSAATLSIDIGCSPWRNMACYATSGLPLSYATSNAAVIAVDSATGKLDPKGAGTATITLSQAGDSHFSAASNVTLSIAISEDRSQTIDFPALPDMNASSSAQTSPWEPPHPPDLAVTYTSSDTSKATISGSTMTLLQPMPWDRYPLPPHNPVAPIQVTPILLTWQRKVSPKPSPSVSQISLLPLLPCPIGNITDGTTFSLSATASSRLSVTFESNDTNLLTISGTTATIKDAGPVTITASQAGNDSYNPASKSRSFNLLKKIKPLPLRRLRTPIPRSLPSLRCFCIFRTYGDL